jgi:hypothetical protein
LILVLFILVFSAGQQERQGAGKADLRLLDQGWPLAYSPLPVRLLEAPGPDELASWQSVLAKTEIALKEEIFFLWPNHSLYNLRSY